MDKVYQQPETARKYQVVLLGDLNEDGILNIVDIIILVNLIISGEPIDNPLADVNQDESINVLDVISLVNLILE